MADTRIRFACFPSVVQAGKIAEITIFPADLSRRFSAEDEYEVGVIGLLDDMDSYYGAVPPNIDYRVERGCLKFTFFFRREQEYQVSFCRKGEKRTKLALFAADEDLWRLRPLKGDFHSHSYYSDGDDGVAMTPVEYRKEGFDFFALTDHNRMYPSVYARELFSGVKLGMHILKGEEVHTPGSLLHIVHVGGESSVCEQYVRDGEGYRRAVDELEKTLPEVSENYRRRVAMARWACGEIHKAGGIAILPHPYWKPYKYNVSDEFCHLLFAQKMFDAFELVSGVGVECCNLQLALWQEETLRGNGLPVLGNSDSHHHEPDRNEFGCKFSLVFAAANDTPSILAAVRQGYCVAGELSGAQGGEVRFYGSRRLVTFANFLFRTYFGKTKELCAAEGKLMERFVEGEDVSGVLSALADSVDTFYRRFYGLLPAPVIPPERMDWLDRLAQAQETSGVLTKGSNITLTPGRERRK